MKHALCTLLAVLLAFTLAIPAWAEEAEHVGGEVFEETGGPNPEDVGDGIFNEPVLHAIYLYPASYDGSEYQRDQIIKTVINEKSTSIQYDLDSKISFGFDHNSMGTTFEVTLNAPNGTYETRLNSEVFDEWHLYKGRNEFIITLRDESTVLPTSVYTFIVNCTHPDAKDSSNPDPVSKTGWMQENGRWRYYSNNTLLTSVWVQDNKGWLYIGSDGYVLTYGWASDSGGWYYMDSSGYISKNTWAKDSAGWYYMNSSGRMMKSQWLEWNGSWYYLQANGLMSTSTITIDGKQQKFDSSGRWLGAA